MKPLLTLSLLLLAGCADLQPWQRGTLAKPEMSPDYLPQQRELRGHIYSSREAASTAASGNGGGCGCN